MKLSIDFSHLPPRAGKQSRIPDQARLTSALDKLPDFELRLLGTVLASARQDEIEKQGSSSLPPSIEVPSRDEIKKGLAGYAASHGILTPQEAIRQHAAYMSGQSSTHGLTLPFRLVMNVGRMLDAFQSRDEVVTKVMVGLSFALAGSGPQQVVGLDLALATLYNVSK